MIQALNDTKAKNVYVCNLVTKPGQTDGFDVCDFAAEVERFGAFKLDYVFYNDAKPSQYLLDRYAKEGEYWVTYDEATLDRMHFEAVGGHFVSREAHEPAAASDPIAATRTLIRHDADAIAKQLMKLYFS